jgi:hypothetical protein
LHDSSSFFAGYPPLYPALLAAWMKLTQFSPAGVRSLNHVLISLAALLVWLGALRTNLVASKGHRVLLVALVALGYGMSLGYRSGRPDTLMALLVAALFVASTLRVAAWRYVGLALIASLLPLAGMQMLPYTAMMLVLLLFLLGRRYSRELACIAVGVGIGATALVLLYAANGALERFVASMRLGADVSLTRALVDNKTFHHRNTVPKDPSLLALLMAGLVLLRQRMKAREPMLRTPLAFALIAAVAVPVGMIASGKFPTYYAWMVYLPLAVAVCGALASGKGARPATALALMACILGLPFQLAYAAYDRQDRNYGPVTAAIGPLVQPNDAVYADYSAYYVARSKARLVFTKHYLARLNSDERRSISVIIVDPADAVSVQAALGGKWNEVGPEISPRHSMLIEDLAGVPSKFGMFDLKYRLQSYRRAGSGAQN